MEMNQIQMYEVLKSKLGEKETKAFVHLIDEKMDAKINARKHELATKEDISVLKDDIAALRLSTKEDMMKLKDELLRTFFVTSLGQLIAIVACVISLILVIAKK
jgi:hypothetical protein